MSAHVLLNLLKELRKRDERQGLSNILHRGSYMSAHVFIEFIKRVGEKR